ncbi:MAG: hypothetical protein GX757_11340 [Clostridiales bacterium]|jgi:hypothetical protein|nr:hypothetical protein [Clostridiales bacterium]
MKKEDLKAAFDQIQPGPDAEKRMLNKIMNYKDSRKENTMRTLNIKRLVPVLGLVIIIAGSLLIHNFLPGRSNGNVPEGEIGDIQTDDLGDAREDMAVPITNQFRLGDRHYIILHDELREEFGFTAQVTEDDIGKKIADIQDTPDPSLEGLEVYEYTPAGGEAVVAVKRENSYELFNFFTFESYNNNQDEDAAVYLKLYGINGPEDIKTVQLIEYTEQSKVEGKLNVVGEITDPADIQQFYGYYSVLKNASDKYFEKLFGYQPSSDPGNVTTDPAPDMDIEMSAPDAGAAPDAGSAPDTDIAPDAVNTAVDTPAQASYGGTTVDEPVAQDLPAVAEDMPLNLDEPVSSDSSASSSGMMDMGDTGNSQSGSVPPSQGSAGDALANPIGVRIYNKNGVYYETMYYRNIGFLSRYEVSKEFADFLASHMR